MGKNKRPAAPLDPGSSVLPKPSPIESGVASAPLNKRQSKNISTAKGRSSTDSQGDSRPPSTVVESTVLTEGKVERAQKEAASFCH